MLSRGLVEHPARPSLPVPAYLPASAMAVIPWMRTHVTRLAARNPQLALTDLWDEAITALCRACAYFNPVPPPGTGNGRDGSAYNPTKAFKAYATLVVSRGLWRYALPDTRHRHNRRPFTISLEEFTEHRDAESNRTPRGHADQPRLTPWQLQLPSAEVEALAREAVQTYACPVATRTPRRRSAT